MVEKLDAGRYAVICDNCERYIFPKEEYKTVNDKHYCSKCEKL